MSLKSGLLAESKQNPQAFISLVELTSPKQSTGRSATTAELRGLKDDMLGAYATEYAHLSSRQRVPLVSTASAAVHAACDDSAQLPCLLYVQVGSFVHALPSLSAASKASQLDWLPEGATAVHVGVPGVNTQCSVLSGQVWAKSAGCPHTLRLEFFAEHSAVDAIISAAMCGLSREKVPKSLKQRRMLSCTSFSTLKLMAGPQTVAAVDTTSTCTAPPL